MIQLMRNIKTWSMRIVPRVNMTEIYIGNIFLIPSGLPSRDSSNWSSSRYFFVSFYFYFYSLFFLASCRVGYKAPCHYISLHDDRGLFPDKSFDECLSLCCADPQCRSFDYNDVKTGENCGLSSYTKEEVGDSYLYNCAKNWHYHEVGG